MALSQILGFLSLAGFVAFFVYVLYRTRIGTKDNWHFQDHRIEQLPEVLGFALRSCLNGGSVDIEEPDSEKFVQFKKYIRRDRTYGLELGFPDATWSSDYCEALRAALRADQIPFREDLVNTGEVRSFVLVDCGQDLELAERLVRRCLTDLFGLAPDSRLKSTVNDYSTFHDTVDDPDYANPSIAEFWPEFRVREQEKGHPDPATAFGAAASIVGLIICFPVLWSLAFLFTGATAAWHIELQSMRLAGQSSTAAVFVIYCSLYVSTALFRRKLIRKLKITPLTAFEKTIGPFSWIALPLAVILSWLGY